MAYLTALFIKSRLTASEPIQVDTIFNWLLVLLPLLILEADPTLLGFNLANRTNVSVNLSGHLDLEANLSVGIIREISPSGDVDDSKTGDQSTP